MTAAIPTLSSLYDPTQSEAKWQSYWEDGQVFKADPSRQGAVYSVVIPPPNVTGTLHMGHAFNASLIDTLVRYHRMTGKNTLCLPGTDHASIAVQTILEKQLAAEGKTRDDLGREKFLERAWEWKAASGGTIVNQMRRLGFSVDWTRERFTMDAGLSKAVLEAFVKLYEEGLIYRGKYLVNWCPASQSAVSDLEVESKEVDGKLWYFRYPLAAGEGYLEVATTRPETMLGDTGVAVNPKDDRYKHLVGKMLKLPLLGREIPIVADEHVDPAFGTGCVKVTPAHDPNDFEMGTRHSLQFINILNKDGTINENGGEFQGQDRFEARKNVVAALEAAGHLVKIEDYKHTVPYSDRGKVPVEPLLSTQWFVKIAPLAQAALQDLDQANAPIFVPERWSKVYRDWLVNLRDWCISRQLWWGHQIPAWYVVSQTNGQIADDTPFVVARNAEEAQKLAIAEFGENVQLEQDRDVLDTWFSSGLWPFSTLGWPDNTADIDRYYPTSTLVTGFDIIFFWVARMTMMSKHLTGQMPFKHVYIHGLVRDEAGKKMSKSANNGVDPLVLIDQYGTDALRYTLIREVAGAGQDISLRLNRQLYALNVVKRLIAQTPEEQLIDKLQAYLKDLRSGKSTPELIKALQTDLKAQTDNAKPVPEFADRLTQNLETLEKSLQEREPLSESVEASRNFANKLWNASRFVLMNLDGQTPAQLGQPDRGKLEVSDRWILSRFNQVTQSVCQNLENHALGEAAKQMYEFIWGDFCDWYIELAKSRLNGEDKASRQVVQQVLAQVLEGILKLLHPFMPHITEEIWHTLTQQPKDGKASLATQLYPEIDASLINSELEQNFELLIGTIRTVRNLRAEAGIKPGERIEAILQTEDDREHHILTEGWFYIKELAKVKTLSISQPNGARAVTAVADSNAITSRSNPFGDSQYGTKAWSEMTWVERFQLDEVLQIVGNFFATYQRQLLVSGALGLFVLVMEILRAILDTVHQVPFLPSVLEMVGFGYSLWYGKQNLWQSVDRARTWQQLQQLKQDVIGAPRLIATTDATPASAIAASRNETRPTEGSQMFAGVVGTVQVLIPLAGLVDVQALRGKLEKDLGKLDGEIQSLNARLTNPKFVDKAPADVVQAVRDSLAAAEKQAAILQGRLNML